MELVTSLISPEPYTAPLYSGSTMRVHPCTFNRGSMPEVDFSPRVRVSRMCTPSVMPFASKVLKTACLTSSVEGMSENMSVWALSCKRRRCSSIW